MRLPSQTQLLNHRTDCQKAYQNTSKMFGNQTLRKWSLSSKQPGNNMSDIETGPTVSRINSFLLRRYNYLDRYHSQSSLGLSKIKVSSCKYTCFENNSLMI